jgi:hypothetical protein
MRVYGMERVFSSLEGNGGIGWVESCEFVSEDSVLYPVCEFHEGTGLDESDGMDRFVYEEFELC